MALWLASCKAEMLVPYGVVSRLIKSSWNVVMLGIVRSTYLSMYVYVRIHTILVSPISEVHPNTTNT